MYFIPAHALDTALADISDVPTVEVEDSGLLSVTFTGNYSNPVNDLADFLAALQRYDWTASEAAREGMEWSDGGYGGGGTAVFHGLRLEDGTRSTYSACDRCGGTDGGDQEQVGNEWACADCRADDEPESPYDTREEAAGLR